MNIKEQLEILHDQIEDEYDGAKKYFHIYVATQSPIYLQMAREELGHADQIISEARKISATISMDSPLLFHYQTKCLEKLYYKIEELKEDVK